MMLFPGSTREKCELPSVLISKAQVLSTQLKQPPLSSSSTYFRVYEHTVRTYSEGRMTSADVKLGSKGHKTGR